MANKKLATLAYRLQDINSLRNLFSELNFDFADKPVNKDSWSKEQKQMVSEARIIASKNDYKMYYIQTDTDSLKEWKGIAAKIIKQNNGFCMVCSHNPSGFKWVFSSLSKEFSASFSETRHVPIDIKPDTGVPKTFVDFLEKIRIDDKTTASSIVSKISDAFDSFAIQIHDELTVNVFEALKMLSEGIILDKSNKLALNEHSLEEIREPIFILLYRIMFVLYAEDRAVFPDNKFYHDNLSLKWIKSEWILKSDNNITEYAVYERLKRLFRVIEMGSENLDYDPKEFFMRSYYGRLFDRKIHASLEKWKIPNKNLLAALGFLTRTQDKGNYFFLDYAALETRHLGAIYEHLLEYHLTIKNGKVADLPNPKERKTTGSYYTPKYIVDYIVENTVGPLIDEIIKNTDDPSKQIDKILDLNILDPAMGSGHFLVGATNYIATRICEIECDEITEEALVERKRDVARRCIYGVDLNPLAVDLASVSLWLETLSSERPLSFLSAHLKTGNSLIGSSIDDIFEKQTTLMESAKGRANFKKTVREFIMLEMLDDDTADAVKTKIAKYNAIQSKGTIYYNLKFLLDTKIAKSFGVDVPPIGDFVAKIGENSLDFYSDERWQQVKDAAQEHSFFHWDLEFPDIFYDEDGNRRKNPGFDGVVGNPPWQILKPDVDEFFSPLYDLSNNIQKFSKLTKDKKNAFVKKCLKDEKILTDWENYQHDYKKQMNFFNKSNSYEYQTSKVNGKTSSSDINLYKLFVERSWQILKKKAYCGLITPSGIYSDLGSKGLRILLLTKNKLMHLFSFINRKGVFEGIHRQFKFCMFIFQKDGITTKFLSSFYMDDVHILKNYDKIAYTYDAKIIQTISPDSYSFIECKNQSEFEIFEKLYQYPLLGSDKWNFKASAEFHMTSNSKLFHTTNVGFPLYEGKMINMFTHKFAKPRYWIYEKEGTQYLLEKEKNRTQNHNVEIKRIDYEEYRLVWRTITNATNERTLISTILPPKVFLGNSLNYLDPLYFDSEKYVRTMTSEETFFLCGMFNSFPVDFILRHRVATNLNIFYLMELPIPRYDENNSLHKMIFECAQKLVCSTNEFSNICKNSHNFELVNNLNKRLVLQAQINAASCKIYNLSREELKLILENFPIVTDKLKNQTLCEFDLIEYYN